MFNLKLNNVTQDTENYSKKTSFRSFKSRHCAYIIYRVKTRFCLKRNPFLFKKTFYLTSKTLILPRIRFSTGETIFGRSQNNPTSFTLNNIFDTVRFIIRYRYSVHSTVHWITEGNVWCKMAVRVWALFVVDKQ